MKPSESALIIAFLCAIAAQTAKPEHAWPFVFGEMLWFIVAFIRKWRND